MKYILLLFTILSGNCLKAQVWTDSLSKAQTFHKEQKYSEALDIYKRAKVNTANDKYLKGEIAQSAYKSEDFESAYASLQTALKHESNPIELSRLHYNQGNVCFKQGNYKEAIENYKLSLRKNPENEDAKYNLSQALRKKKNQEKESKNQEKESKNQEKELSQNKANKSDIEPGKKRQEFSLEKQAADRTLDELLKNAQNTKRKLSNKSAQRKNKNEKDW